MDKEVSPSVLIVRQMGKWGECSCGGNVLYYSDYGVRCRECGRLYGTWVENLKKAKEEEKQKKQEFDRRMELKKFDDEQLI